MSKINNFILINIVFFIFLLISTAKAENKIKIELQIENEIITNIDFKQERNYLVALNNNLKNLPKDQLNQISRESLIREKIKRIELMKFYDFSKTEKYSNKLLEDFYKRLNFKNENEFNNYIKNYNLKISVIKEKLRIEALWNELIYTKFKDKVSIDEEEIKKKVKKKKNFIHVYSLSEILFELKSNENLSDKYNLVIKNINSSGFKNSANIFSISDTSKFGGEIGWVDETQLNELMLKEIKTLKINDITKPIQTTNGYLIIKVNDKKKKEVTVDFNKTVKRLIKMENNRQLQQFSLIYFNKIKQNVFISEK